MTPNVTSYSYKPTSRHAVTIQCSVGCSFAIASNICPITAIIIMIILIINLFIFIYVATLKCKFIMCLDIKTEKNEAKQSILRKTKKIKRNE